MKRVREHAGCVRSIATVGATKVTGMTRSVSQEEMAAADHARKLSNERNDLPHRQM